MRPARTLFALVLFGALFTTATAGFGQDRALQHLIQGKKLFWEAKFDQALGALRQAVGVRDAKTEYLFEAYLYMGFVLTRQGAPNSDIDAAFEQAIKLDPSRELDEMLIPPDLTERFNAVRDELVGCLYVVTDPPDLNLVVVQNDSVLYRETAPATICDLVSRDYQLLFTKEGYEQQLIPLDLEAGIVDTLRVTLELSLQTDKGGTGLLGWLARGGVAVAAAAVIYKTVLEGGADSNLRELPAPPDRPTPTSKR